MKYIFRKIEKDEIPEMFRLILERIKWMDQNGIRQWNVTDYERTYPQSYYEDKRKAGEVFVLQDLATSQIVSAAVLQEEDERWADPAPALYLHNFVTKVGENGVGTIFIKEAEQYAIQKGKRYMRLDSAKDNLKLAQYYEDLGFIKAGICDEGLYQGVLRQKQLQIGDCEAK